MSRLDDLISEHCPHGVPHRPLGEVGEFIRGRRFTKNDYVGSGLGTIHYGELYTTYGTTASSTTRFVRADMAATLRFATTGDLVIAGTGENIEEVGKAVAWLGSEAVAVHDDCYIYRHDQDPTFFSYLFQSTPFHRQKMKLVSDSKLSRVSGSNLARIVVPVPPLEVQREIVAILGTMERLEAELEAELEARRVQYAFYREKLLTFHPDDPAVRMSTLAQVCDRVFSGGTPLATRREYYGGEIPWLRTQEVNYQDIRATSQSITEAGLAQSSAKWVRPDSVVIAISGAGVTRGRAAVTKVPLTTNQHCCNLEVNGSVAHYRFVYHWVVYNYERLRVRGHGNRSDLNLGIIKAFPIPVPSLESQTRIAATLDSFDALTNDLTAGLPAEIAARRKQYEYYRDRLLTFEELPA